MIICDIGSCWGDSLSAAEEAVLMLKDAGVNYIKFQLCEEKGGNIPLPAEYLVDLVEMKGVTISASVWDSEGYQIVKNSGAKWIKFAHSACTSENVELIAKAVDDFCDVVVTVPLMSDLNIPKVHKLWTYEINGVPVYPVTAAINHDRMYEEYDGFSCHSRSLTEAIDAIGHGAKIVEIHANPLGITGTPDSKFAMDIQDVSKIVSRMAIQTWY